MPLVEFKCDKCGLFSEEFCEELPYTATCFHCKGPMRRLFSSASFTFDFKAGFNRGAGEYFDTKKEFDTYLRENNVEVAT